MSDHVCNVLPELERFLVPVESLNFDPKNPQVHPARNLEAIQASFTEHGQDQLLVVQKDGMIVRKGNGRLKAAKALGWTHIAALVVDEPTPNGIRRGLADNQASYLAERDDKILADLLADLEESTQDMPPVAGFTMEEIDALLDAGRGDDLTDGVDFGRSDPENFKPVDETGTVARYAVKVQVGTYHFSLPPDYYYDKWIDDIGKRVGFKPADVFEEIARLLGIPAEAVMKYQSDKKRYRGKDGEEESAAEAEAAKKKQPKAPKKKSKKRGKKGAA